MAPAFGDEADLKPQQLASIHNSTDQSILPQLLNSLRTSDQGEQQNFNTSTAGPGTMIATTIATDSTPKLSPMANHVILDNIFAWLAKRDLAKAARVNQLWFYRSRYVLWQHVDIRHFEDVANDRFSLYASAVRQIGLDRQEVELYLTQICDHKVEDFRPLSMTPWPVLRVLHIHFNNVPINETIKDQTMGLEELTITSFDNMPLTLCTLPKWPKVKRLHIDTFRDIYWPQNCPEPTGFAGPSQPWKGLTAFSSDSSGFMPLPTTFLNGILDTPTLLSLSISDSSLGAIQNHPRRKCIRTLDLKLSSVDNIASVADIFPNLTRLGLWLGRIEDVEIPYRAGIETLGQLKQLTELCIKLSPMICLWRSDPEMSGNELISVLRNMPQLQKACFNFYIEDNDFDKPFMERLAETNPRLEYLEVDFPLQMTAQTVPHELFEPNNNLHTLLCQELIGVEYPDSGEGRGVFLDCLKAFFPRISRFDCADTWSTPGTVTLRSLVYKFTL
ncbi:hypothetical protein C8035_v010780 [Colletotrichum spinosum]|uniref:F-box domain-containing protein n=1 Tax=Colletotrichum spinosum TaxID=1347390 RepID=A0A4V6QEG8_9PEZI|nr:hypothetical protein C8035_v010780 [Colletotrichum spinosum]